MTSAEHIARIIAAAERAVPRPEDDDAEWIGEYEDEATAKVNTTDRASE